MSRLFKLGLIIVIALAALPVHAQGGLTPEEKALFERMAAADAALDSLSSYVETTFSTMQTDLVMHVGDSNFTFTSTTTLERTSYVIPGSTPNVYVEASALVEEGNSIDGYYTYTLGGEARLVNGVLYVLVERVPAEGAVLPDDLDPLPSGWTQIDNLADWPGLAALSLDSVLSGQESSDISQDISAWEALNPEVTLETITWGSGQPADVITLTIGAANLFAGSGAAGLDLQQGFLGLAADRLSDDSGITISATLNAEDLVLRAAMEIQVAAAGIDATQEDSTLPPGTTYDTTVTLSETHKYSHYNEPLEAVAAPL